MKRLLCSLPVVALVAFGACGRLNFSPLATSDGTVSDGPAPDACAFSAWSTPQRLAAISSGGNDWGGEISPDGLDFYFASDRAGTFDLYESHRASRAQPFASAALVAGVNTSNVEDDISVTPDGLAAYFSSDRGPACIFQASRAQKSDPFSNVTSLPLCDTQVATGAFITRDGLSLYYNLGPSVNAPWGTLMVSTRASTADPIVAGVVVAGLQGGEDKGFAALSADELTIYFETADPDHHVWQATRPDRTSAFANAIKIPGINDTDIDEDPSITADGLELYFASRRPGTNLADLFFATRTCL